MKTLDKNSTKLLKSYKKDLKKFIRNNDLDSEFYEDIEERIEERTLLWKFSPKKGICVSLARDIVRDIVELLVEY